MNDKVKPDRAAELGFESADDFAQRKIQEEKEAQAKYPWLLQAQRKYRKMLKELVKQERTAPREYKAS